MAADSLAMMPWFPRDFIAATRAMRLAERGAYRELLDFQWEMGPLPKAVDRLAQLLGVSMDEFNSVWPAIASKFMETEAGLVNQRLEEHRKKALEQREKKRQAAASTNAKRYAERPAKRYAESSQQVSSLRDASDSPPSPSPSPSNKKDSVELSPQDSSLGSTLPTKAGQRAAPEPTFEMTVEWKPNAINLDWLTESGMSLARQVEVIGEFVTWARHSKLRKSDKNWQLTFLRNPKVKSAVGAARAGASNGKTQGSRRSGGETAYQRAERRLREWAEGAGVEA